MSDAEFQAAVLQRLDTIDQRLDQLGGEVRLIHTRLDRLGNQVDRIETRVDRLDDSAYRSGMYRAGGGSGLPMAAKGE